MKVRHKTDRTPWETEGVGRAVREDETAETSATKAPFMGLFLRVLYGIIPKELRRGVARKRALGGPLGARAQ